MKLIKPILLVAFTIMLGTQTMLAQDVLNKKISLETSNENITQILGLIEKEANVRFAYSAENFGTDKLYCNYKVQPLSNILTQVLEKDNIAYKVQGNLIVLYKKEAANKRTDTIITGKVLSTSNEALSSVSVTVKGGQSGTSTDETGNYAISVPDHNAVLVFSHVGYNSEEVAINGRDVVNISLTPSSSSLEDVVVVGYGTQKKAVVTGAISSVKASDLENQQIGRIEQALQGRASGLTIASSSGAPGSAATVRIRGTTSLNDGANEPLYVVDGVVVTSGGIDYLNPSDIESIEVLKDAASAAIYGARSAAGVILVTTKKGKSGALRILYNGYYGVQSPAKKT